MITTYPSATRLVAASVYSLTPGLVIPRYHWTRFANALSKVSLAPAQLTLDLAGVDGVSAYHGQGRFLNRGDQVFVGSLSSSADRALPADHKCVHYFDVLLFIMPPDIVRSRPHYHG